jgi:galactofuranose transport system ATP-binding protein
MGSMGGPRPAPGAKVLEMRDVSKQYGATRALEGVSLELRAGGVYGLIGVNGSGKSTLMKIIAGAERASAGDMHLDGSWYRPRNVAYARRLGVGIVPQELPIVASVSVADNLFLGRWPTRLGILRSAASRVAATRALAELGADIDVRRPAGELNLGEQQLTVIARALAQQPRLVLMDEPTSALAGADVVRLRQIVRSIAAQGRTVFLVSQRLDDVFSVCDQVMVLRNGSLIESKPVGALTTDRAIELMLHGHPDAQRRAPTRRPRAQLADDRPTGPATSALAVKDLQVRGRSARLSLQVTAGEIVGLAGLPGSGTSEFLRALFGLVPASARTIHVFGRPYRIGGPARGIRRGMAYVTGDRQREGLVPDASVATNIAMVRNRRARGGPGHLHRVHREARDQIVALRIRPGDPDLPVRTLSGGNQQKVVFARWMLAKPRLWLLDDATRGVDIGARDEIHAAIRASTQADGAAALVVSSDLLELFEVCDRFVVFRSGAVVADVARGDTTPQSVKALATGEMTASA